MFFVGKEFSEKILVMWDPSVNASHPSFWRMLSSTYFGGGAGLDQSQYDFWVNQNCSQLPGTIVLRLFWFSNCF